MDQMSKLKILNDVKDLSRVSPATHSVDRSMPPNKKCIPGEADGEILHVVQNDKGWAEVPAPANRCSVVILTLLIENYRMSLVTEDAHRV